MVFLYSINLLIYALIVTLSTFNGIFHTYVFGIKWFRIWVQFSITTLFGTMKFLTTYPVMLSLPILCSHPYESFWQDCILTYQYQHFPALWYWFPSYCFPSSDKRLWSFLSWSFGCFPSLVCCIALWINLLYWSFIQVCHFYLFITYHWYYQKYWFLNLVSMRIHSLRVYVICWNP